MLKGIGSRSRSVGAAPGNPEEVLDAVFDFAENLIRQQRAFAKQMLRAASKGQPDIADATSIAEQSTGSSTESRPSGTAGPKATPAVSPPA